MENLFSVKDKVVLITGGNQNIGAGVAKGFAEAGAKVIIADVSEENSKTIRAYFDEKGYDYMWLKLDVSSPENVDQVMDAIMAKYGRLDVLFNNAGVRVNQTGLEHSPDKWDWLFDINVKGTMLCSQAAAKIMKQQGGGKIINTSSISAYRGMHMRTSYCASKGAINALTAACAVEWSQYGIYVNAVAWGGVNMDQIPVEEMPDGMKATVKLIPMMPMLNKDTAFGIVSFLASKASDGIAGQVIMCDGGWSIIGKPGDQYK